VRFSSSPSASETIGPRTSFFQYKVQSGDQMWAIAATFNIALADLIAANPQIANPDRLFVGALLNIRRSGGTQRNLRRRPLTVGRDRPVRPGV